MKYRKGDDGVQSGRADAYVWQENYIIRRFKKPANARTPAQTTQRSNFGFLSGNWNDLSETERAAWNAMTVTVVDRVGHTVTLNGKDIYVFVNRNLFNAGAALITTPATGRAPVPLTSISWANATAGNMTVAFTATPITGTASALIFATGPQSAGTNKPKQSLYKLVTTVAPGGASPADITIPYEDIFGAVPAGASVFVKAILVDRNTGFATAPIVNRAITT